MSLQVGETTLPTHLVLLAQHHIHPGGLPHHWLLEGGQLLVLAQVNVLDVVDYLQTLKHY